MSTTIQTVPTVPSVPATPSLFEASRQWAERPADQRFKSLAELHAACEGFRKSAHEKRGVPYASLRVEADRGAVKLVGKGGIPASLTHWAFGQLAARVGAPAGYLRELPATLAAQNLNHGLARRAENERTDGALESAAILFRAEDWKEAKGIEAHAFLSEQYTRIWNTDVTGRLIQLTQQSPEWQPAPAAFDGSRGLYASDHDLFAFLVDNDRRIFESDPNGGLGRGFFCWNSEVGATSFGIKTFFYQYVCGNHIVWGAKGVKELRLRHVGNADDRAFGALALELRSYADSSAKEDEEKVRRAQAKVLGKTKDEVLDAVFGLRGVQLSRGLIEEGYERAELHEGWYGDPRSVWGVVSGITEVARDMEYADERVRAEREAGKVLSLAF